MDSEKESEWERWHPENLEERQSLTDLWPQESTMTLDLDEDRIVENPPAVAPPVKTIPVSETSDKKR